jgi:peptidoglycan/LPS O-acetylase OafA/YrhL
MVRRVKREIMSFPRGGYRPDIDGLRAIALLGVLIFHIHGNVLPGGFLGVDVFFVISGYLISGIIQRGLDRGDFSFATFYERRIKRLMPALLALIVVVSIPSMVWMWPADLKDYAKSVKFVAISLANFHYLDVVGDYFNEHVDEVPLLHTWSLAVEEQFYLVFPVLLLGLNQLFKRGRGLLVALWVLFAISISACLWRGQSSPMSCFFLLPYRAWELLAGTLLALHSFRPPGRKAAIALGWAGLAMILVSFVWVSESNLVPGLSPVPACLGAALLIYSGSLEGVVTRKLLGAKIMAGLGLISYSVYLWHWPLIVFGKAAFDQAGWVTGAGLFVASILIGWLSWIYVEQPFRGRTAWSRKKVYSAWAIATVMLIAGSQLVRNARACPGVSRWMCRPCLRLRKRRTPIRCEPRGTTTLPRHRCSGMPGWSQASPCGETVMRKRCFRRSIVWRRKGRCRSSSIPPRGRSLCRA